MPNALSDTSAFKFRDLDLSGALLSWSDDLAQRFASHEYLKRDGAEFEPMGANPGRFSFRCCYLGEGWAAKYRLLAQTIRNEPRGALVHPIFGQVQVACMGISGATVNPAEGRDLIEFTITFSEDALDKAIAAEQAEGPAAKASQADERSTEFTTAIAAIASAAPAVGAAATALVSSISTFTADALAASLAIAPDLSLGSKLASVATSTSEMLAALAADTSSTDASRYEAYALAYETYSICLELDAALASIKPVVIAYTVPGLTSLGALSQLLYGRDAAAKLDEILTLNRIAYPAAIPAGTVLQVTAPTI